MSIHEEPRNPTPGPFGSVSSRLSEFASSDARTWGGRSEHQLAVPEHSRSTRSGVGALSNLDLLTTEQSLIAADAAAALSDSALIQDEIAVLRALDWGLKGVEVASR